MSKMLTSVARMLRTDMTHQMLTAGAKRIFKRETNRSERRAPLGLEEYGTEEDDIILAKPFFAENDVVCSSCGSVSPEHRIIYVKRREWGPCDCCEHFSCEPICPDCRMS